MKSQFQEGTWIHVRLEFATKADLATLVAELYARPQYSHPSLEFGGGTKIFALHRDRVDEPDGRRVALATHRGGEVANIEYGPPDSDEEFDPVTYNGPGSITLWMAPNLIDDLENPPPPIAAIAALVTVIRL